MPCCNCSVCCCIFNDALLFCNNLEFVKLTTQPAPLHETACVMSDCEKSHCFPFFHFSNKSATDTHGNIEFLALQSNPPPCWCATLQGVHSLGLCLPSIMQSLMDSTEGRRQGLLDHWKQNSNHLHPPFFPWIHLCPRMSSCFVAMQAHTHTQTHTHSYTQVDKHKFTHMVSRLPCVVFLGPSLRRSPIATSLWSSLIKDAACLYQSVQIRLRTVALYFPLRQLEGMKGKDIVFQFSHKIHPPPPFFGTFSLLLRCECLLWICEHLQDVCVFERSCFSLSLLLLLLSLLVDELEEAFSLAGTCAY